MKSIRCLTLLLLGLASTPAGAQQVPQPASAATQALAATAQQAELVRRQDAEMERAALQVARLVDANRMMEVWRGASKVAQQAATEEQFIRQISADRVTVGSTVSRNRPTVSRAVYGPHQAVPEGAYVSVAFATRFSNSEQVVRELVSFRLDEDKVWRVAGYSLR